MRRARILVAAVGSQLRGDDGFGPAVLERLRGRLPPHVAARNFGSHGIALVQALYDRYNMLVIVDAAHRAGPSGAVRVVRPIVELPQAPDSPHGLDALADVHVASLDRALPLALALRVLPPQVWIVECEAKCVAPYRVGLSRPVRSAVELACREVLALIDEHELSQP